MTRRMKGGVWNAAAAAAAAAAADIYMSGEEYSNESMLAELEENPMARNLTIDGTYITDIDDLAGMANIRILHLTGNQVAEIADFPPELEDLTIEYEPLTRIGRFPAGISAIWLSNLSLDAGLPEFPQNLKQLRISNIGLDEDAILRLPAGLERIEMDIPYSIDVMGGNFMNLQRFVVGQRAYGVNDELPEKYRDIVRIVGGEEGNGFAAPAGQNNWAQNQNQNNQFHVQNQNVNYNNYNGGARRKASRSARKTSRSARKTRKTRKVRKVRKVRKTRKVRKLRRSTLNRTRRLK